MKKIILILFFIFLFVPSLYSQVVKLNTGLATSSIHNTQNVNGMLNNSDTEYSVLVGMDYLEFNNLYLSSEAGYVRFIGYQNIQVGGLDEPWVATEYWNYFHINTTLRYQIPLGGYAHLFLGAGPKLDYLIGSDQFNNDTYQEGKFKKNRTSFGAKAEAGFVQDINNFRIGLNIAHFLHAESIGGNGFIEFNKKKHIMVGLSIGMRFN